MLRIKLTFLNWIDRIIDFSAVNNEYFQGVIKLLTKNSTLSFLDFEEEIKNMETIMK